MKILLGVIIGAAAIGILLLLREARRNAPTYRLRRLDEWEEELQEMPANIAQQYFKEVA